MTGTRTAVLGAGAMGTALALHLATTGAGPTLLATDLDGAIQEAWRTGRPHPALGCPFSHIPCVSPEQWPEVLADARLVFVAVSSGGLQRILTAAAPAASPDAWVLATKGWQPGTFRRPTEVAAAVLGEAPVAAITGPGIAAELVAGAPTALLVASADPAARRLARQALTGSWTTVFTSSDVAGAETAAAFKNVVSIAVGLVVGMAERFTGDDGRRSFANVEGAVFSRGLLDMAALVRAAGGRIGTVLGLAGAGDAFTTCRRGRNARFGRLLGQGATVDAAVLAIGSTVEGVANTAAAAEIATRAGLDLPTVRVVQQALRMELADHGAGERLLGLFATAFAIDPSLSTRRDTAPS
jgi:glycerol-3-phosphate dehydrogenase (NAD(P)+)